MASSPVVIHVFTRDLRLQDNPSLFHAATCGRVWPIFVDDHAFDPYPAGGASRWWLHEALGCLHRQLQGQLSCFQGNWVQVITALVTRFEIAGVFWNRCFDQYRREQEAELVHVLQSRGIATRSFNGSLLWEPSNICKDDGSPYKVFTPFYRRGCLSGPFAPRLVLPDPQYIAYVEVQQYDPGLAVSSLRLIPQGEGEWHLKLAKYWTVGESAAHKRLVTFLAHGIMEYKKGRDFPAKLRVSMLSPYLSHGHISPSQIWEAVTQLPSDENVEHFKSELGWREFAYYLLYHYPQLPTQNLQSKFDAFAWVEEPKQLYAWQRGQTGIPIVDAGMRQLWETGYMHNRLRMVVGSFLVKNMGQHWSMGERWFRKCLVDFDLASNSAAWQWVAGCGTDAAPYFRIFNPVAQGERFDIEGDFTKKYVPELSTLPKNCLFNPWEAPQLVLQAANVTLGENYPYPLVDLKQSRAQALAKFQRISMK